MKLSVLKTPLILGAAAILATGIVGAGFQLNTARAAVEAAPATSTITAMRRLTESQYRHSLADIFGADIEIKGRFEPEEREHGLLAIGASNASISASGFQQYYAMARGVSTQALDERRRVRTLPCQPADPKAADSACAENFIRAVGGKLFRRPLTEADLKARVALANAIATEEKDFYAGARLALTSLLTAPEFLFRREVAVQGANGPELDGYGRAARLSFLLWDTSPDAELMRAAAAGELQTPAGLKAQVTRLINSPRLEVGTRAMFSDILQFSTFDQATKNADIYPKYSLTVAESAKEQTLRTVIDHLLTRNGDYRDLLTTRNTFINRSVASVYKIPYTYAGEWMPYTFPASADRPGILTQITFLAAFSHAGRSSPTKRGVGLNEVFMCTETPLPPDDVDFSIINNTSNGALKTVRSRLLAHATEETCAGCHTLTDPIGLSLERFDGMAQPRATENGEPIDVRAEIDGVKFDGATGLANVLRNNPRIPACFVRMTYLYGIGRNPTEAERAFIKAQTLAFSKDGHRYRGLLVRLATSPEFYGIVSQASPEPHVAASTPSTPASRQRAGG